jgi:hypothetical protein
MVSRGFWGGFAEPASMRLARAGAGAVAMTLLKVLDEALFLPLFRDIYD